MDKPSGATGVDIPAGRLHSAAMPALASTLAIALTAAPSGYTGGVWNLEDLVQLPGTHWAVVSAMRDKTHAGALRLLDLAHPARPATVLAVPGVAARRADSRAAMNDLRADLKADIQTFRADVASDLLAAEAKAAAEHKQTREQIVGLRRAVIKYHTTVIGHPDLRPLEAH